MQLRSKRSATCARQLTTLFLYALISVLACDLVEAQSGRKSKGAPPSPPTPSVETQSPAKPTETKSVTPRLSIIVVKNVPSANVSLWSGTAYRDFIERLRETASVEVREGKEMNRKEAVDLAKRQESENVYVAWLQLEVDVADTETASIATINPGCLSINYILFSPVTGKSKARGKVYQDGQQSVCVGTASSPRPTSGSQAGRAPVAYTIRKAAREAADRILDALALAKPPRLYVLRRVRSLTTDYQVHNAFKS